MSQLQGAAQWFELELSANQIPRLFHIARRSKGRQALEAKIKLVIHFYKSGAKIVALSLLDEIQPHCEGDLKDVVNEISATIVPQDEKRVLIKYSDQESEFIELLKKGPKEKSELMRALFGVAPEELRDFTLLENRIKNLVFRIKKKSPGAIEVARGIYSLNVKKI